MTNDIKIDLKARGTDFVLASVFKDLLPFLGFLLIAAPTLGYCFWMFGNLKTGLSRETEFNRLVQECTQQQLQVYGRTDSHACRKAVNAEFRVYENL